MTDNEANKNLPAQIAEAISGIPKALVPGTFKALDRLVSATIDIPVAWLGQQKLTHKLSHTRWLKEQLQRLLH